MFWVFYYFGIYGGGFYVNEGLQVEQDIFNNCVVIGGVGGILVCLIGSDIKLVLVDDCGYDYWNKYQYQINGGQMVDSGFVKYINESKDLYDGNIGNICWYWVI